MQRPMITHGWGSKGGQKTRPLLLFHVTKIMESVAPWGVMVECNDGSMISIIGEIPGPLQILDRTTTECTLHAQRLRSSVSKFADQYKHRIRSNTADGAGNNQKAERVGGREDRPGVCADIMGFCLIVFFNSIC